MELKDFIGKTVINVKTKQRYKLHQITSPLIEVILTERADNGVLNVYRYPTINGDPISDGRLVFEDETLLEPFKAVYEAHCRSEEGRYEEYGYWMRRA